MLSTPLCLSLGVFPENLDLNQFVYLNTMADNIFTKNFMDNLEQLDLKTKCDIAITSFFFN